ncbi:MAG: class I SAM-dependent methyltransferase [Bryobacterales bacterium]|nr:class I SAM-dependent methyltransferase [Bryobacteraceae bacterium]MDW8355225.1 class I SAM-dependent methyltransferase [Bryobacterales bacterium]
MKTDAALLEWMRRDWDQRARQDAYYYAAFGRRGQDDAEFFATAAPVVRNLEQELRWILPRGGRLDRALEIGCGPGRLLRALSRHFQEIHGVDVSEEMVRLARAKLHDVANARVHLGNGTDLTGFADATFDFVYSYAVFQHIPSREVVFRYLAEAVRVLKPGGLLRCQLNGLPEEAPAYDTWSGVRIRPEEIREFARTWSVRLLALEGVMTQYMWVTAMKPPLTAGGRAAPCRIRRLTNAHSSEPVIPCRGRFAALSAWVEGLPADCDLLSLGARIGTGAGTVYYVGPPERDGLQQINVTLPPGLRSGVERFALLRHGQLLCPASIVRLLPPGPMVPRIVSVTDAVNLLAGPRIESGYVKITLEEAQDPDSLEARVDGALCSDKEVFCVDPGPPRHEINFRLPRGLSPGRHCLELRLGRRCFAPVTIEVAG